MYKVSKTCRGPETRTDTLGEHEAPREAGQSGSLVDDPSNSPPAHPTSLPTEVGQAEHGPMMVSVFCQGGQTRGAALPC